MKTIKYFFILSLFVSIFLLRTSIYAKADDIQKSVVDTKDYNVIIAYDGEDEKDIFNGLKNEKKNDFIKNKIKEVFGYIAKGEFNKIQAMKKENPKLDIIIQKKDSNDNFDFVNNVNFPINENDLKKFNVVPYAHDTDTYVSNKYFSVSNDSGLAYADCLARVRVDRNLPSRRVTIVNISVSIQKSVGKFGFTPVYNGDNTARLGWGYIGLDGYGNGNIRFKAYFDKTVDMY
ncbi:Uncharacterised protein [Urinicoccus massiliensis]|uniref:Uncharacterized protein n=1 Tax=Urinicoccus massiliensis TaxID=1723382 RepID=A0A8H2M3T6_9FIRM|nr:hypothetical protein [Urinicoccus massiliensis]VFB15646.1 Uncharacterised protein [Urinicoccus massiliensis]